MKKWLIVCGFFALIGSNDFAVRAENIQMKNKLRRTVQNAQIENYNKKAVASASFVWKKKIYWKSRSRFRGGALNPKRPMLLRVEEKTSSCKVVWTGTYFLAPKVCAKKDDFELKEIKLTLSTGKTVVVSGSNLSVRGDFAFISVNKQDVTGIMPAQVAVLPSGRDLEDVYGGEINSAIYSFFLAKGIISPRANRMSGRKVTLKIGDPFFYKGKLVALCSEVPSRLPVGIFSSPEDSLVVLRQNNGAGILLK